MAYCPAFDPLAPYVPTVVGFVDCHARALGEDGYRALGSGSPMGMAISGFVTIYVGLIGYRMLFGDLPRVREIVLAAVRVGAVLAIATQWPAYQVLVYNIVVDEPTALAGRIFPAGGLGGEDLAGLTLRIQGAYDVFEAIIHPEPRGPGTEQSTGTVESGGAATNQPPAPSTLKRNLNAAELESLGGAEKALLVSTLGGLLSTRVVAAVLLALGPLFIGFFLFDATRGLFIGWVRALAATIFASVGVLAALGIELALITPQLTALYKTLEDGFVVPALVGEVAATSALFSILIITTLAGTGIAAFGLRLPDAVRDGIFRISDRLRGPVVAMGTNDGSRLFPAVSQNRERSRVQLVADAVGMLDRRDDVRGAGIAGLRVAVAGNLDSGPRGGIAEPMGQSPNRTTKRYSPKARQRDGRR